MNTMHGRVNSLRTAAAALLLSAVLAAEAPAAGPALAAADGSGGATRYLIRPVYSNVGFSIVKWSVIKEQGIFRDFQGTLDWDAAHPERSAVELVVDAKSLDTKNDGRDGVVRSSDFLDTDRYPTLVFRSTAVQPAGNGGSGAVTGDLTIHGVTHRIRFPVTSLGAREIPNVGKLVGFETTFRIRRTDYGVLGSKWGAVPGILDDEVEIHIVIGGVRPVR